MPRVDEAAWQDPRAAPSSRLGTFAQMDALSDRWIFLVDKMLSGGLGSQHFMHARILGSPVIRLYNAALKGTEYLIRAMTDSRIRTIIRSV